MSEYSLSALSILRNPTATMQWYIVPIFVMLLYAISNQIKNKRWNVLFGAIAFWGMDLFNEIWNSIVFHATGFAPVWGTPMGVGETSLLILIGYNIEISIMFFFMGMAICLSLPENKKAKIFGVNNRILIAIVSAIACVAVECFLNHANLLTWEYSWWSIKCPWLVFLIGYLPFFAMSIFVHDLSTRKKQIIAISSILGVDLILLIIFGSIGWM